MNVYLNILPSALSVTLLLTKWATKIWTWEIRTNVVFVSTRFKVRGGHFNFLSMIIDDVLGKIVLLMR